MTYRVTTYEDAFKGVLGVEIDEKIKKLINELEKEGHTEKSIAFSIWKTQDKLLAYKYDNRFLSILRNEINKWSWKKDDPRWDEYWKKKKESDKLTNLKEGKGYIYFIQGEFGGAINIGYSKNPKRRLKELQTGRPETLKILYIMEGTENKKESIYELLKPSRLKGEWFKRDDRLISYLNGLQENGGVLSE